MTTRNSMNEFITVIFNYNNNNDNNKNIHN